MTKKNIIRGTVFLMICLVVFVYLNMAFGFAKSDENSKVFDSFYAENGKSLDGIYLGSSAVHRYWNGSLAYETYGSCIFALATSSQPIVLYQYLIEEAEKTQDPDLYILELRGIALSADNMKDVGVRRVTDNMRLSLTRVNAVNTALRFAEKGDNDVDLEKLDYYLPILKYHGRWSSGNLSTDDLLLRDVTDPEKGFLLGKNSCKQAAQKEPAYTDSRQPLAEEMEEALLDLLSYCDNLDADVLFVMSPYSEQDTLKLARLNEAMRIVEEHGYTCLNFNTKELSEAVGIDYSKDLYNSKHVNILGSEKYTEYLAAYIHQHYNLADHRGDAEYKSWDEAYEYYLDYTAEGRKKLEK